MPALDDVLRIGWRPVAAGAATLGIGLAAGWVVAGEAARWPARFVQGWLAVLLRGVRHRQGLVRAVVICANNTATLALLVLLGGVPGGAWVGICGIGVAMGIALRQLQLEDVAPAVASAGPPRATHRIGLVLCMLEIPAILVGLGLAMGQLAAPNNLAPAEVWRVFGTLVVPALAVAAVGEALLLGRFHAR